MLFPGSALAQRVPKVFNLTSDLTNSTPSVKTPDAQTLGDVYVGDRKGHLYTWIDDSTWTINTDFDTTTNVVLVPNGWTKPTGRWISTDTGGGTNTVDVSDKLDKNGGVANGVSGSFSSITIDGVNPTTKFGTVDINANTLSNRVNVANANITIVSNNINTVAANLTTVSNSVASNTANLTTVSNLVNTKQPILTGALTSVTNVDLTPSMAVISDSLGKVASSANVSDVELSRLDGVTSPIQSQIDSNANSLSNRIDTKQPVITGAASSVTNIDLSASMAVISDSSGKIASSANVSDVELSRLDGITSSVQNQIDSNANSLSNRIDTKQPVIIGAASSVTNINLSASMAVISDSSGKIASSAQVSDVELGRLDGVTSSVQSQLDALFSASGTNAFGIVQSMSQLVSAAAVPSHASAYLLRGYYTNYPGVGGGIWYYDSGSTYPTNRAVIASVNGGRFFPLLYNNCIDITRFGAVSALSASSGTEQAKADALRMQQDHTYKDGKVLFFPEGIWRISTSITEVAVGTAGTTYSVTNASATNLAIGSTVIYVDKTGTNVGPTVLVGDVIQFSSSETDFQYLVTASTLTNGHSITNMGIITIASPGLRAAVADNALMAVRGQRPLVIKGVNNGIGLDQYVRAQMSSEIMMETDNTPIIVAAVTHHGMIEDLSLTYVNTQYANQSNSACIYNGPDDEFFQWTVRGVCMNKGAYGIHIRESTAGANNGAANNIFDGIITRYAAISGVRIAKAGTDNHLRFWYIQSGGFVTTNGLSGANAQSYTFTNAWKVGTLITLQLTGIPGSVNVGSYVSVSWDDSATTFDGQFITKSVTNSLTNLLTFDVVSSLTSSNLNTNAGTCLVIAKTQMTEPLVYLGAAFEYEGNSIDIEVTSGSATTGKPLCLDNQGVGFIGMLHIEYAFARGQNQALVRNGGQLVIGNVRVVNCGRLAEVTTFIFENNTLRYPEIAGGTPGYLEVGHLGIYDLSSMSASGGTWMIQTNYATCDPVVIHKYTRLPTIRANSSSTWGVNGAQSYTLTTLP